MEGSALNQENISLTKRYNPLKDISFWSLLFANIITVFLYYKGGMTRGEFFLVFWVQSFFIGMITFITILSTKESFVKDITLTNNKVLKGNAAKISSALFFLFHYGIFQCGHLVFLLIIFWADLSSKSLVLVITVSLSFLASHVISFVRKQIIQKQEESEQRVDVTTLAAAPYTRIIPMHIILIIGGFLSKENNDLIFFVFIFLKIIIDLSIHSLKQFLKDPKFIKQFKIKIYH